MKKFTQIMALLLALLLTFTSCTVGGEGDSTETTAPITTEAPTETPTEEPTEEPTEATTKEPEVIIEEPSYREKVSRTREELEAMYNLVDEDFETLAAKLQAFEDIALVSDDYDAVDAVYMEFEDFFYHVETQITIANVIRYIDTTDEEASNRYLDAYEKYGDIFNEYIEVCKAVYETSPIRDQLFEDWTEEEIKELFAYDPETQELREENERIQAEIEALPEKEAYEKTPALYAQMVVNYNKLAQLEGYDNYYDYASVEIYGRDYTKDDIATFRTLVIDNIIAEFDEVGTRWAVLYQVLPQADFNIFYDLALSPFDANKENYFEGYINSYGDSSTGEGFRHLTENRNLIFADSPNSHPSAFQTYFREFETPFCLFGSSGQYTSAMVHEMGHYYAALYNPDVSSYDLAEVQSQGNEMLFVKYMGGQVNRDIYKAFRGYSVFNFIYATMVGIIIDEFEQRVYSAENVENFTAEDFDAIMKEVCEQYGGFDFIKNNFGDMNEYWRMVAPTSAVYYVSYSMSAMAALSLLVTAEEDEAAAREMYRIIVEDVEEDAAFMEAIAMAGLLSPFEEEVFKKVVQIAIE